jgi:RNA polymerase sigma-70 factor (sigma-E family)
MADHKEFDAFVVAQYRSLLRTAYLLVRDRDLAEDLLQTALTKTWFAWGRIDADPVPYVRRVMVTTSVSWWRRRWRLEVPTGNLPEPRTSTTGASADAHDLWVAIGHLPARQRAVIVLRYYEDLSEAETARVLDCSAGAVKSHCSRALAKLRVDSALTPLTDERSRS